MAIFTYSMSKEEKQTAVREISKQEKQLRSEGRVQELEELLGPKARAKVWNFTVIKMCGYGCIDNADAL